VERLSRADHQIIAVGRDFAPERSGHLERRRVARLDIHLIADIGEHHQAGDRMITLSVRPADVQEQIDLGRGEC
jgi:hypothetical protein